MRRAVGRASPFARSYLLEAHPVSFSKNVLTIGFDPEFADHLGLVDNAKNRTLVQTKLSELGFAEAQVKFVKAEAPANLARPPQPGIEGPPQPAAVAPAPDAPDSAKAEGAGSRDKPKAGSVPLHREDFKNDPLIQKALEIFKGQIVEVRS